MSNDSYTIRPLSDDEIPLLEEFLYQAIFQPEGGSAIPREAINDPQQWVYIEEFGTKPDDRCFVAECDGQVVGMVWTRILADGPVKGYGNIDQHTPEFAISLLEKYRGCGIGTALMSQMLQQLKDEGYRRASLSVQKNNYAVKMYEALGFRTIKEQDHDYIMMVNLFDGRIRLRRPVAEDMETVYSKWASDPDVTKYMAWATHKERADADALLYMSDDMWESYGCGPMIIEHAQTGDIMGSAGLLFNESDEVGVGYVLRREYQGQGYATEALKQNIDIARILGVKRLVAGIHSENLASQNVAKKNGFTYDPKDTSMRCIFPQIDPHNEETVVKYVLDLKS